VLVTEEMLDQEQHTSSLVKIHDYSRFCSTPSEKLIRMTRLLWSFVPGNARAEKVF
jgi:hypothetical protein